jgi:SAM-dependent methyltransferase
MTTSDVPANGATQSDVSSHNLLLATFVAAIFLSAGLLFAVQPMFTKMVLPRLGGAAAVWSVAMVFFQTVLLAGYAYAHLLTRLVPGRKSVFIHIAVTIIACLALPLHIASGWGRPPPVGEAFWLIGLFTVSIGLPFFALSANGPLLQAWFVRCDHPATKDPYFLYAASNAGSFLALLAYPVMVEPFVRLGPQTVIWTVGFYVLIALIGGCGALMLRFPNPVPVDAAEGDDAVAPRWSDVVSWVGLAAVPSGLLIAVTAHIATDVAAVPLFWAIPLALYLLTFVIVFQTRPIIPHALVVEAQPLFILGLVVVFVITPVEWIIGLILIHLSVFFVCVLMCHGELARRRPAPRYLTAYYMWISAGGMIGGILTGLVAPNVFNWVAEYPILLVFALLCRPGLALPVSGSGQYPMLAALAAATLCLAGASAFDFNFDSTLFSVLVGVLLGLTVHFWRAPLTLAAIVAFLLYAGQTYNQGTSDLQVRNFFGVLNVSESQDGAYRVLWHGTTAQGAQRLLDYNGKPLTGRPEIISEFYPGGGISQVFDAVRARVAGPMNFAVVGLGTGTLACQVKPGDTLTYYEIDPDIARIARDPKLFSFYSECAPQTKIVIGDARLTLSDAPDGSYDLIFVDAFIGAAIPIHLLTREAMEIYLRKLKPHGVVAMHISNRNLELASVVAGIADANNAIARVYDGGDAQDDADHHIWVPRVAVVARTPEDFGALAKSEFWPVRSRDMTQRVWTDDYSNILGALLRNLRERDELLGD